MKKFFLMCVLLLVISVSYPQILEVDYPEEIVVYGDTTNFEVVIRNRSNQTRVILPMFESLEQEIKIETFTPFILPEEEISVFISVKKPIEDGIYYLILKIDDGEDYIEYERIPLRIINPLHPLRIVEYHAKITDRETIFEVQVENLFSPRELEFIFVVSDLHGGSEVFETRNIGVGNESFNFRFKIGREVYNSERISSFRIRYEHEGKTYSSSDQQIRLGSVDEYMAYIKAKEIVYDMFLGEEDYRELGTPPVTGYTSVRTPHTSNLCEWYIGEDVYSTSREFLEEIVPSTILTERLFQSYDTLHLRFKNKMCIYPEQTLVTITLLIMIIGLIMLVGWNSVEPC